MTSRPGRSGHGRLRSAAVMTVVVAAEHLAIEREPFIMTFRCAAARIEGVTGGAQADDRPAALHESAQVFHLVGGQRPSPSKDHHEVGIGEDLHAGDVVAIVALSFGAALEDFAAQCVFQLELVREAREALGRAVFALGRDESDQRSSIVAESKRRPARQDRRGDRRAHVFLDVLDHQVGPGKVADLRPASRIVHGVGQVAHEDDVLAGLGQIAKSEGPAQHAHVRMDAHQDDVPDAALLQEVPDLDARVTDRVCLCNPDRLDLPAPGRTLLAWWPAIAAAVRMVDRIPDGLLGLVLPVTPRGDARRQAGRLRRVHRTPAGRMALVMTDGTTGRVNDEHASVPGQRDHAVHHRPQLPDAPGRPLAPVPVPHVADDDRRLAGRPLLPLAEHPVCPVAVGYLAAIAHIHRQCPTRIGRCLLTEADQQSCHADDHS